MQFVMIRHYPPPPPGVFTSNFCLMRETGTHQGRRMMSRIQVLPQLVVALSSVLAFICQPAAGAFGSGGNDKVLLREITVLTLYHGRQTTSRRTSSVPQLKCNGGSAGCNSFTPQVVQCYNRGTDGYDVQWECKTDMDNAYRFGTVEVSCEGYDYPEDPYIYRGSCGLEYSLDLTKEGSQQKGGHHHSYYGNDGGHNRHSVQGPSAVGDLITVAVVALIIYAFYKTCIAGPARQPGDDGDDRPHGGRGGYSGGGGSGGSGSPPPPGFRDDYMPGGSCSGNRGAAAPGAGGGGGFWTGAMTGGMLGYLFGNRGNYGQGYGTGYGNGWGTGWGTGYGGRTRGWGSTGWGGGSSGWGGGGSSGWGGSFGGGGSTGTRTASGFGGTRRR